MSMLQIPHGPEDKVCPYHRKAMNTVCHKCPKWLMVRGTNNNTGQQIDRWDCADAFIPVLLIELANQQRQTGAAVESFRNETVRLNALGLITPQVASPQMLPQVQHPPTLTGTAPRMVGRSRNGGVE